IAHGDGAAHPILVEAVTPVCAAVEAAPLAVDLPVALLGPDGAHVVDGMQVIDPVDHRAGVHGVAVVEGHLELAPGGQALEPGQVVGDGGAAPGGGRVPVVVPRGPGPAPAGQQPLVGVEHAVVVLEGDGAQDLLLFPGGIPQQGQGLVTVAGEDHVV